MHGYELRVFKTTPYPFKIDYPSFKAQQVKSFPCNYMLIEQSISD
ncbi:hypothetical protein PTET_b0706 [Pseudoalteromonas tetraodonis]|nr:hypothetical protein PSM_B0575 [Pseudoalteromonas sp. SM9913]ATD05329.1 hypothetical protein PTET_b0706 [Pseudoalteromonas tetraodonis]